MSLLVHSSVEFFLELFCDVWNEGKRENNDLGRINDTQNSSSLWQKQLVAIPAMHLASAKDS